MSYTLQLRDARNSIQLKNISGLCSDSDEFVSVLNEAMRRLDRRGNFFDRDRLMEFCVYNGCITWPRMVGTVLGVRPCGCDSMDIRNNWYNILGPRNCNNFRAAWVMKDHGTAPAYNDISGEDGKYIRIYPTKREDVGKTVTLFGVDGNGQPLQEKVGNIWRRGVTLTIQAPYIQSSMLIKRISSVVKEATQANIIVYEYESSTGYQRDIALYEPSETHPNYRRSIIDGFCNFPGPLEESNGVRWKKIEALVKLKFVEVSSDEDFLPISNLDAIKFAIQAIKLEEANQDDEAEVKIAKAIRELNFELRDKNPGPQTTVKINPIGRYLANPI